MEKQKTPEQVREEKWQTALIYKKVFNSPDGQTVLDDMKEKFGWMRSSAKHGDLATDVFLNEGMKSVLYHIETQLGKQNPNDTEMPKEAISG